jgi:hypothetical protein
MPVFIFFSATIDGRNLIFGHKLHIGTPYRGKHFWTHQIPTSCFPILLIFIHIEHTFVYAHFSSHFSKQLLMTEIKENALFERVESEKQIVLDL